MDWIELTPKHGIDNKDLIYLIAITNIKIVLWQLISTYNDIHKNLLITALWLRNKIKLQLEVIFVHLGHEFSRVGGYVEHMGHEFPRVGGLCWTYGTWIVKGRGVMLNIWDMNFQGMGGYVEHI